MEKITNEEITQYLDLKDKIETRCRQLLHTRDIFTFTEYILFDNKIFITYENPYYDPYTYNKLFNENNYKEDVYGDSVLYKTVVYDMDYFLSEDRDKEYDYYINYICKQRK